MIINKEAINQAIADFNSVEKAIEAAGVDVPYGTDTSEYGNKIAEACQGKYQQGYNNGLSEGESGITTIIDPAIESHGVDIPEGMDKSEYADKVDEVYQTGYDMGLVDGGIDWSQLTDWRYFSYQDNRNYLVPKLKYSDTANGTIFNSMFYGCKALTSIPPIDTSKGTSFGQMFYDCYSLKEIPPLDTSEGTSFVYMFSGCRALISAPQIDTSKGTKVNSLYSGCYELTTVPLLNTSNSTSFSYMFSNCYKLTEIPPLDTSNGTSFTQMFYLCYKLTEIPPLDTSKGTNFNYMFYSCSKLTTIAKLNLSNLSSNNWDSMFGTCSSLQNVTFEGTIPVRGNKSVFSSSSKLTVESLMSFINALQNMSDTATYTITIGSTNLAKLTAEQVKIATDKRIKLQ